ncbi:MAG TPA: bifunctional pyr operon transcriptional regulator/uracil phosphoribosyltransferase PyrR [Bacillota bacterium]
MRRALTRIAHEIVERNRGAEALTLIGIRTRGVPLAQRLAALIEGIEGRRPPVGELDVTPFRDDRGDRADSTAARALTGVDTVADRIVILVDDVLYTGRTARAALEAVIAYGRPAKVQLAALIDRGHRELPIRPDYVGKNLPTSRAEHVAVRLAEIDGSEEVVILAPAGSG